MSLDDAKALGPGIAYPHGDDIPGPGEAIPLAEGVLWLRLPLPMKLDHVNVYALDDGDGWTIVDTGFQSPDTIAAWEAALVGPLKGKPVTRVIATHHHPDHIGMSGWFTDRGAQLLTTRTSWLQTRVMMTEPKEAALEGQLLHMTRAGAPEEMLEGAKKRFGFFAKFVHPLPGSYRRIKEGDRIEAGGRHWRVFIGNGHAPEHATLWSADGEVVLAGDQILPKISPNLGVYAQEPEADPVAEWIEACRRFQAYAKPGQIALPGHNRPFTGLPKRLEMLIENHHGALKRLRKHLGEWRNAVDCFDTLYKRTIHPAEFGLAMVEAISHLNHLYEAGETDRRLDADGAYRFRMKEGS